MKVKSKDLEFIRTSDGKIGVGISNPNGGEEGGFKVLKWCKPSLLTDVEKELLVEKAINELKEAL